LDDVRIGPLPDPPPEPWEFHALAPPLPTLPPLELTEEGLRALRDKKTLRAILATLPGVDPDDPRFEVFWQ
jgi:hypothetical protein